MIQECQRPATKAEQEYQDNNYATRRMIYSTYCAVGALIGAIVLLGALMLFN